MGKVLGLDIGISSVGWGIIESESGEIVDAGVRLFEEASRNANEERRGFRGSRRLKRRRTHRLDRVKKLLYENGFPLEGIGEINPYEARKSAIYHEVSKEELAAAIFHIVKRRGVVLDIPDTDESLGDELSTKEQLSRNSKLLKEKFICEIQIERSKSGIEKIRNHENRFTTADYIRELNAILNNQKKYHVELTDSLIDEIVEIVEKRRAYYEGPGSDKSPTSYGSYFIDKNGQLQYVSMIDKMRGKCTYFPDKDRIPKMSYTADLFDLLNGDLNKLQIDGEYLSKEDKEFLVENYINKGKNITLPQILKYKNAVPDALVSGYRINMKTGSPLFTEFKGFKLILKIVKEKSLPTDLLNNIDVMDEMVNILTAEKSYSRREEQLHELLGYYDNPDRQRIIDAFKETVEFVGYHSLSKKAMKLIMEDLWCTNKNQMELYSELKMEQKRLEKLTSTKNIMFDGDAILSSVAKRAHRETIKIVNEARRKYGEFDSIIVETAREKNSEDERKQYSAFQKEIGKFEKRMAGILGVSELKDLRLNGKQHLALKLWDAQDGKCLYSGKTIIANEIVSNFSLFEIDHIIPVSISFDDSQSNKVLCYHSQNQKKGQRTPYQYLSSGESERSFDAFKIEVLNLFKGKKINGKKKDYFLEVRDVKRNEELQRQFINRNLIDTQYAMRSFSTNLRTYFQVNDIETTVLSIRGAFTAAIRRRARIKKDRNSGHAHHAIDALIVAAIGKLPVFELFREFDMNDQGVIFEKSTGEILPGDDFFNGKMIRFFRGLINYESQIKYSHKVDRKANRAMSNQTIYGTRKDGDDVYCLAKYKNIYRLDKGAVAPVLKRIEKNPESFLIAKHNPELFNLIQKIVKEYGKSDNPFKAYYDEHGYILKDGKVPVKHLRYYDNKLGVHMNITDNYPNAKNEVVLLKVKGVRVDLYRNVEGKYKYVGVPYYWFKTVGDQLILDMERYETELKKDYKKIDETYEFQLSLYKNDLFSYEKDGELVERVFRGDANPRQNKIESEYVYKIRERENRSAGILSPSTISNVIKYNVDVLGNRYKVQKEKFNIYLQK
ncbi:type II CRISPR RNA-guided endonuclease Cas9 [Sporosarcina sp. P13]|uniref:type II CRISPR RNA-guided endonuclease Cas9 n=1 Tax=Sporosarcina sp. P13 TaxID=2048263 RepID=UPI0013044B85|nr:type II CRISPR RNA-guided endonuclease Cas9 [Sporosarcina sp. P13]